MLMECGAMVMAGMFLALLDPWAGLFLAVVSVFLMVDVFQKPQVKEMVTVSANAKAEEQKVEEGS